MGAAKSKHVADRMRWEAGGQGQMRLVLGGRLDSQTTGDLWREAGHKLARRKCSDLVIDASGVDYCDGAGISLLLWLRGHQEKSGGSFAVEGLRGEFVRLMEMLDPGMIERPRHRRLSIRRWIESAGRLAFGLWHDMRTQVTFVGEISAAMCRVLVRPGRMRWKDALLIAESAGADAFGIVSLVGFLFGLILAFQAAMPMRQFGAEIYVADLVALSLFRVLGPLMTAIILAARTGSAFAAELGTMKVNEEIDALTTMGLDPVRFLAVTRVTAGMIVTPLLAVFANLFGLIGAGVVMVSLGFPVVTYYNEVLSAVDAVDLVSGLGKAVVFGVLVAGVGCLRGLQTGGGSRAVGESATRAVVSGIVLIIVAEGVFAVIFYVLGI